MLFKHYELANVNLLRLVCHRRTLQLNRKLTSVVTAKRFPLQAVCGRVGALLGPRAPTTPVTAKSLAVPSFTCWTFTVPVVWSITSVAYIIVCVAALALVFAALFITLLSCSSSLVDATGTPTRLEPPAGSRDANVAKDFGRNFN